MPERIRLGTALVSLPLSSRTFQNLPSGPQQILTYTHTAPITQHIAVLLLALVVLSILVYRLYRVDL